MHMSVMALAINQNELQNICISDNAKKSSMMHPYVPSYYIHAIMPVRAYKCRMCVSVDVCVLACIARRFNGLLAPLPALGSNRN